MTTRVYLALGAPAVLCALVAACASADPATTIAAVGDWQRPTLLRLDADGRADVERVLARSRLGSAWFGVDVPTDGRVSLSVRTAGVEPAAASHARKSACTRRPAVAAVVDPRSASCHPTTMPVPTGHMNRIAPVAGADGNRRHGHRRR